MSSSDDYTYDHFSAPAYQDEKDFQQVPPGRREQELQEFKRQWTTNVDGWTQQAIASGSDRYYNQLQTPIPTSAAVAPPILWPAFPYRLLQYLGQGSAPPNPYNHSKDDLYHLADYGYLPDGSSFPQIPHMGAICHWTPPYCDEPDFWDCTDQFITYGPYGPRGWMDEYCEWSVTRDADGNITRIDFVCENPEYWNALWSVNPELVRTLYQNTLNFEVPEGQEIAVSLDDLYLKDPSTGAPVIDPSTGRPAYNPLNKWNSGPVSYRGGGDQSAFYGGAMHLTSTPNTLQTEMGLAGLTSVQSPIANTDALALLCCLQSGQPYRNSDPHITQSVNRYVVTGNLQVALADPAGLYIQPPEFTSANFRLPDNVPNLPPGAKVEDCWHVVRGTDSLTDPVTKTPFPGALILHAVFQIPKAWRDAGVTLTISDLLLGYKQRKGSAPAELVGNPIRYAGQVAETMSVALYARALAPTTPLTPVSCATIGAPSKASPQQLMHAALWDAFYGTSVPNPMKHAIPLASNSTFIAPFVKPGATGVKMALTYATAQQSNDPSKITVKASASGGKDAKTGQPADVDADISFTPTDVVNIDYAVPGNTYPFSVSNLINTPPYTQYLKVVYLDVSVAADAGASLRYIFISDDGTMYGSAPALLNVVSSDFTP